MGDEIFLHLRFFHRRCGFERGFQIAIFADELGGGLGADAGDAGHIVDAVAHQREDVAKLLRLDAEFAHHIVGAAPLILHRVVHVDAGLDELHQILVGADDGDVPARRDGGLGVAGDDVVGLEPRFLDAGEGEGAGGVADHRELRNQVFRRGRAVRLILVVHVVAEGVAALVQYHCEMGRAFCFAQLIGQLPEHGGVAIDRADGLAMLVGERRKLMIGAEDIAAAVHEVEMILRHGEGIAGYAGWLQWGCRCRKRVPGSRLG